MNLSMVVPWVSSTWIYVKLIVDQVRVHCWQLKRCRDVIRKHCFQPGCYNVMECAGSAEQLMLSIMLETCYCVGVCFTCILEFMSNAGVPQFIIYAIINEGASRLHAYVPQWGQSSPEQGLTWNLDQAMWCFEIAALAATGLLHVNALAVTLKLWFDLSRMQNRYRVAYLGTVQSMPCWEQVSKSL